MWSSAAASQPGNRGLMRDRKRIEALIADDEQLMRRLSDIEAYIELGQGRCGRGAARSRTREMNSLRGILRGA